MITLNVLSKHNGVSAHTVHYYSCLGLRNPAKNDVYWFINSASEALRIESYEMIEAQRHV